MTNAAASYRVLMTGAQMQNARWRLCHVRRHAEPIQTIMDTTASANPRGPRASPAASPQAPHDDRDARSHDALSLRACAGGVRDRVDALDWTQVERALDERGNAVLRGLATRAECEALASLYTRDQLYRSRVVMARHGFGRGEYRYFAYPLPACIGALRTTLYPRLVPIANRWSDAMRTDVRYPERHADFIARCHAAGQTRPTPLILEYQAADYNCLHQDLYGEHVFPLQVTILLSRPDHDFTGGEFVLTEQRPRQQSRVEVVPLHQGDAVVFAVNDRPVQGARGYHRVRLRHGVSRLRSGHRHTLGIIFHDAH
jgi:hypothetical protein